MHMLWKCVKRCLGQMLKGFTLYAYDSLRLVILNFHKWKQAIAMKFGGGLHQNISYRFLHKIYFMYSFVVVSPWSIMCHQVRQCILETSLIMISETDFWWGTNQNKVCEIQWSLLKKAINAHATRKECQTKCSSRKSLKLKSFKWNNH